MSLFQQWSCNINPIQDEGAKKATPTSVSHVTSTNVGLSFNPFATLL